MSEVKLTPIDTALELAGDGIPVFPCKSDKKPLTSHGLHDASTDTETIRQWWQRWPNALLAAVTGEASGFVVLDIDPNGTDWYVENWDILGGMRTHRTPRDGFHVFYRYPTGLDIRNSASKIAPGVDIRGNGGYVIWWPAHGHKTGGSMDEISDMPQWLADQVTRPKAKESAPQKPVGDVADIIPEGQRNDALTSFAGTLRRRALSSDEIAEHLRFMNQRRCVPPLPDADVVTIANSVGRYEPADPIRVEQPKEIEPFDLSAASVAELLDRPAPPREYIIDERLPLGIVGILGGAGSVGKGMTVMQLGFSVATGLPWLGMEVSRPGAVFVISTEDDRDEIHRRLQTVVEHYADEHCAFDEDKWAEYTALVKERLYILDRTGDDNRLTAKIDRETMRTALADRVIATCARIDEPVLVVLDPLARFDGGDPNDNADGTRLIETAEYIRKNTGCTVLLPHHVSKEGIKDADAGQEAIRGASGLVDGARWVGLLATLRADNAKQYGIDKEDARWYVRFNVVKGNYGPPWGGMWLKRLPGGVLAPTTLEPKASNTEAKERKADAEYVELVRRIAQLIQREGPMPKRRLSDHYGGTTNVLKAGHMKVRNTVTRALSEGHLVMSICPETRKDVVSVPDGNLAGIAA